MKPALFHPKVRPILKTLPEDVRRIMGKAILDLQSGYALGMPLSRPMPSVAIGVHELRVKDASGTYRVFYFCKSKRGVLIFHAFVKKTQSTPHHEISLASKRLQEMINEES